MCQILWLPMHGSTRKSTVTPNLQLEEWKLGVNQGGRLYLGPREVEFRTLNFNSHVCLVENVPLPKGPMFV